MSPRRMQALVVAALALLAPSIALAQGFAAAVSPPRFELMLKAGEKTRQVMEITNANVQPTAYSVRTADWRFDDKDAVVFEDRLTPGSCRPWVAVERRDVVIGGAASFRYRFEITVPPDAPAGECRFALMIEGSDQDITTQGGASIGVSARIGVIVYATIGGAAPKLEIVDTRVATINGELLPVVRVRNTGNAHGRLAGFLSGTDASGNRIEFTPSTLPILPGETRALELVTQRDGNEPVRIAYPITIRGKLEWGEQATPFEQRFAP